MINSQLHPAFKSPIDNTVDGIQVDYKRLLADLLGCNHTLLGIAGTHKLNLMQLIAWAAQPAVRALLDAADELANRVAAHKAAQGRAGVVQTLIGQAIGLCESIREQEIASRAARTVLRFGTASHPRSSRRRRDQTRKLKDTLARAGSCSPDSSVAEGTHELQARAKSGRVPRM